MIAGCRGAGFRYIPVVDNRVLLDARHRILPYLSGLV